MSSSILSSGLWTAIATPFLESGDVDYGSLRKLIEFQIAEGITGIVPCGTTGESPTLSKPEHLEVIDRTVKTANGRVPILAGAGSNCTASALKTATEAQALGADALLIVDCYYNGPSSLELRRDYYERILAQVPELPIVPYVIPGRSGCALSAADLAILHQNHPERVPAVKQATGDLERMRADRELAGDSLAILSGDDDLTLTIMRDKGIRCTGGISVMSNLVPGGLSRMIHAELKGDANEADRLAAAIAPLLQSVGIKDEVERKLPNGQSVSTIDGYRNPVPLKAMMAGLGMIGATTRAPLGPMSSTAVQKARQALASVHAADASLLRPIEDAFDVSIDDRLADDAPWVALAGS